MDETLYESCSICGNVSGYDKKSLKGSTWIINGTTIVLCCPCEDELFFKIGKARAIDTKLMEGALDNLGTDYAEDMVCMMPWYNTKWTSKGWKVKLNKELPEE
jgi:hypothetical protein